MRSQFLLSFYTLSSHFITVHFRIILLLLLLLGRVTIFPLETLSVSNVYRV